MYDDRMAVLVVDYNKGKKCRLDIWDLTFEKPVHIMYLPWDLCPGFISLSDDYVWTNALGKVHRFDLPALYEPLKDPCELIHVDDDTQDQEQKTQ